MTQASFKQWLRMLGWKIASWEEIFPSVCHFSAQYPVPSITPPLPENHPFTPFVQNELNDPDPYRFLEYLIAWKEPVLVEPLHGMQIIRGNRLALPLLAIHRGVPISPPYRFQFKKMETKRRIVPEAVLLRHHYGEENYGHFFLDVVPILIMIKRFPALQSVPWLVSRRQWKTSFFQAVLKRLDLLEHPMIIQDGDCIEVQKLWVAKSAFPGAEWLNQIWRFLRVPDAPAGPGRRLFLERPNNSRRPLKNQKAIRDLCLKYGFESVNPGVLEWEDQAKLFSQAEYIVAEHGSACMNILFRKSRPLLLIELFPQNYISTIFFLMTHFIGGRHIRIEGPIDPTSGSYEINEMELQKTLASLLR